MNQKEEIETIRERNITIKLSDADVKRICEKSGGVGLTVAELLESFIGDLVDGTYSNGSDERDTAQQWFERCGFGMFPEKSFLTNLIGLCDVDRAIGISDDIKCFQEELEYSNNHKEEFSEEEIEDLKRDLEDSQEELNEMFQDYIKYSKPDKYGTLEEEMAKVTEWKHEYELLRGEVKYE